MVQVVFASIRRNSASGVKSFSNGSRHGLGEQKRFLNLPPLLEKAKEFTSRDAVVNRDGSFFMYDDVVTDAKRLSHVIANKLGVESLNGTRVGYLCEPSEKYVASKWGVWGSGGCAVPLCTSHPKHELEYILEDCGVKAIIADSKYEELAKELCDEQNKIFIKASGAGTDGLDDTDIGDTSSFALESSKGQTWSENDNAMLIYTSGTTGRPKGVVTTFGALEAQVTDQIAMWGWTEQDRILNCLPLHHVHGIVNLTCVPLYVGACVEFIEPSPERIWKRFLLGDMIGGPLSLFMAVPTIYARLINAYDKFDSQTQTELSQAAGKLRLMVSGSAALPTTVMQRWQEITGHTLLERYGMTEGGMFLTNTLESRIEGHVGIPMPSVQVKLVNEDTRDPIDPESGEPGLLCVKGKNLFKEYWNNPEATAKEFDQDGWFITGDIAQYNKDVGAYKILGRASADIIKSGGYKLSALEIERELLEHPDVDEIAVLGKPDEDLGEVVAAVIKWKPGKEHFNQDEFRKWAESRIAKYKIPRVYHVLDEEIPKNAMGKVNKKSLKGTF